MENHMDAEQEIYIARRFRRRAAVGVLVALFGLAGMSVGTYALHTMPTQTPLIEMDRTHPSCPHSECKIGHPGGKSQVNPDGMGTGLLVVLYLSLCGGITAALLIRD